eukprot:INCI18365.1.p1 GENE.INCI18365.1~~INCI18365.1.p1  ORF type:complete len:757 (+),score=98.09 INCI18365.1:25-2295(+)
MRHNYDTHGVDGYYTSFGAEYKNPHDEPLRKSLGTALTKWSRENRGVSFEQTLDLACGSGEATLAIESWCSRNSVASSPSAAGGSNLGKNAVVRIEGADPYTYDAYAKRVGRGPAERVSFADIQAGHLEGRRYSLIISSFALHLLTDKSQLWATMLQLSFVARHLIVMTPHKRPELQDKMGFVLLDEVREERIRVRLYQSVNFDSSFLRSEGGPRFVGAPKPQSVPATEANGGASKARPQTIAGNAGGVGNHAAPATRTLAQRLARFWGTHAPDKIANIPKVLKSYQGNEHILIQRLEKKYGAAFPPAESECKAATAASCDSVSATWVATPRIPKSNADDACSFPVQPVQHAPVPKTVEQPEIALAPGSCPLDIVSRLHGDLFPPVNSTEVAHSLSDKERMKTDRLAVKSLTYGEIRIDSFHDLLCRRVLGRYAPNEWRMASKEGTSTSATTCQQLSFMDLGSGTGAAVFAAAIAFPFKSCSGVEILASLHTRAEEALAHWQNNAAFRSRLPNHSLRTAIHLRCGDLSTASTELKTVNVGFANSTLFDAPLMARLATVAGNMAPGSLFVTFSKDIPCAHWEVLERYQAMMSWGVCVVIIQRKTTKGHVPSSEGKFYSNRDDHTYAPEGDTGAFLNAIVSKAQNREQTQLLDVSHEAAREAIAAEQSLRERVLAVVWPSSGTQVKVMQKLKRCGVASIQCLKDGLRVVVANAETPGVDLQDIDCEKVPINILLRERGFKIFGTKTLTKLLQVLKQLE